MYVEYISKLRKIAIKSWNICNVSDFFCFLKVMGLLREYVELAKDGGTTLSQW